MNRRTFVQAWMAVMATQGTAISSATAACDLSIQEEGHGSSAITRFDKDGFTAMLGESFRLTGIHGAACKVRLGEVLDQSCCGQISQFTLRFDRLSGELPAEEAIYLLEHPLAGKMALSLQPRTTADRISALTATFGLLI